MNSYSRVYAAIDLDAAESNMRTMKDSLPSTTSMIGAVKIDRYGHGAVSVARTIDPYMEEHTVATINEAVILRRHGIQKTALVLGMTHESRFEDLVRYDIRPVMLHYEEAGKLSEVTVKDSARANTHLTVDTDMNRVGMTLDEASADGTARIAGLPGIRIEGMSTHLVRTDKADKEFYEAQYKRCRDLYEVFHNRGVDIPIRHCPNGTSIVEELDSDGLDTVRARISIYGLYSSDKMIWGRVKLVPAVELKSVIACIKTIEPGTSMGYGDAFVADRPACMATIPMGYEDGYPRSLSNRDAVLTRGKRAGILGRICTDQFMADVTDIPEATGGGQVTLTGEDGEECTTVEGLACVGGGFHYEITCGVGKQVPRACLRDGRAIGQEGYFNDIYEGLRYTQKPTRPKENV